MYDKSDKQSTYLSIEQRAQIRLRGSMKSKQRKDTSKFMIGCMVLFFGFIVIYFIVTYLVEIVTYLVEPFSVLVALFLVIYHLVNHYRTQSKKNRLRSLQIANIDAMKGDDFEHYLAILLKHRGFKTKVTPRSGDFGVDIVATKGGVKYAIQAKRHKEKIPRNAVSDVVAGKQHYGCHKAMVITNNYFKPAAIKLAQSTDCELVDRDKLADWIHDFQKSNKRAISEGTAVRWYERVFRSRSLSGSKTSS